MKGIEGPEVSSFVARVRDTWTRASRSASGIGIEVYAKLTHRCRVDADGLDEAAVHRTEEAGVAVRVFRERDEPAGYAAAGGFVGAAAWALSRALSFEATVSAARPDPDSVAHERWDLDPPVALPSESSMRDLLRGDVGIAWIELGTTLEALIGVEGWLCCRRRSRLWMQSGRSGELHAQRGFAIDKKAPESTQSESTDGALLLRPSAAAPVVEALWGRFGGSGERCGAGLSMVDEPANPLGLAGGEFDDAGFPTAIRPLTSQGHWVANPLGPGSYWRRSFRDAPTVSASNLCVLPSGDAVATGARQVSSCRVWPLSRDVWVLDFGALVARVDPQTLNDRIEAAIAVPQATARGLVLPSLLVGSGLPLQDSRSEEPLAKRRHDSPRR